MMKYFCQTVTKRHPIVTYELLHEKTRFLDYAKSDCIADQRLCFHNRDSPLTLLLKSDSSWLYSFSMTIFRPICVGPGQNNKRPVFFRRGSYFTKDSIIMAPPS